MKRTSHPKDRRPGLLPEGRRWGFGAHSVLPYLTALLHSRAGGEAEVAKSIRNPVFLEMEDKLRALRQRY
jgi:hypothetical protein